MDKKIILHDTQKFEETCGFLKGKVQIKLAGTDKVLFEGFNKVTLMGAELLMRSLFFGATSGLPAYKTLEQLVTSSAPMGSTSNNAAKFIGPVYDIGSTSGAAIGSGTETVSGQKCLWFAIGNDGCESGQNFTVKEVQRNVPIANKSYIPFFMGTQAECRTKAQAGYGLAMKTAASATNYGLFAKQFSQMPSLHIVDGSDKSYTYNNQGVAASLGYPNSSNSNPQAYVEMKMAVTAEDCRTFFSTISDTNRIVNTISILAGVPAAISGVSNIYVPRHTRPITKLNFPSESLADDSKGLDITYQIYF